MNFLQKIGESASRLLESNNDEVIVFLAIFIFMLLGKSGQRDSPPDREGIDSGTVIFLIAFIVVLLLGGSREEEIP